MRVLLLGATGNLGLRLIPALLVHGHQVVAYVRSPQKLQTLAPESVLVRVGIFHGDATDVERLKTAIREHNCTAVVDTAGNQVWPWKEHQLRKIARAVSQAAIEIGEERGIPIQAHFLCGFGELNYPSLDSLPNIAFEQHHETRTLISAISLSKLHWTLVCIAVMLPLRNRIELLSQPETHNLLTGEGVPPAWPRLWVGRIPWIGSSLEIILNTIGYTTKLEHIADFIAEDLENGNQHWVGKLVGFKEREKSQ
ncbi:hypothetical protein LOZ53_002600 [Ophidiomyces ophidiicola]|nr:hypothetical protein LOZ55_005786 [Ophidiomyces ophidiicola]KAI1983674.1 hypothetical protein LOZ54_004836 [Ophidiomyces ophidiicola]KAI1989722.1 hypothetical protein LOZ51_004962 [Ophidiomyces ophidiicola]KAI1992284.1 hypothetical protein LOZ53_002600 [Ophidiomyces ophidiicola]